MQLRELDANLVVVFDALLIDASVTKAAARLGRSPSAVSHALAHLRDIFSDQLFVRAGQRLVPTSRAQELAPTVHIIVSAMESLLRPTEPFNPASLEQKFNLACRDVCELTLLSHLREQLKEKAPGISLTWQGLDGNRYIDDLRSGETNFAVLESCPDEAIGDLCWQMLGTERYVTLVKKGHELAGKKIKKQAFASFPQIFVQPDAGGDNAVRKHVASHGALSDEVIFVSSCFSGLLLARQSDCLVMAPESIAVTLGSSLQLERVMEPFTLFQVDNYLVWHKAQDRDECHSWLRGEIVEMWDQTVGVAGRRGKKVKVV